MSLSFDVTANNADFLKKAEQTRKAIQEVANTADLQAGRISDVFNRISLGTLEDFKDIMSNLPDGAREIEPFKKQIADLEKRLVEATRSIIELQNRSSQPITVKSNSGEIIKETLAYDSLLKSINDILGVRGQNISSLIQEQDAIKINQRELKLLGEIENKGLTLSETQQARRVQLADSLLRHKQAVSSLQQVLNNEIKIEQTAVGSMEEMSRSLERMRLAYKKLDDSSRDSQFGQELARNIQEADLKIKQLDATIGVHSRNVGDYGSQWNGLQYQMQMVARELPNAGISFTTFITSLSNNLPYLIDELNKAQKAYKEYVTAIKSEQTNIPKVESVGSQMLKSVFSWQTGIIVAITLLTAYSKEIGEWVSGLFKANGVISSYQDIQRNVNETLSQSSETLGTQIVQVKSLQNKWGELGEDIKAKKKFIQEAKGDFDNLGVSINTVKEAETLLVDNTPAFIEALKLRAQAVAAQKLASDKYQEAIILRNEAEIESDKEYGFWEKQGNYFKSVWRGFFGKDSDLSLETRMATQRKDNVEQKNTKADTIEEEADAYFNLAEAKKMAANKILEDIDIKGVGTGDSSKQAEALREAQERLKALMSQQALDQIRSEEDLQNQTEQTRIDAMTEGSVKTLAQMKLNHEKEMQQLDRQKEDLLRKKIEEAKAVFDAEENKKTAKDSKHQKQTFDGSNVNLTESEEDAYRKQKMNLDIKQKNDGNNYYKSLLGTYQDYTDRRLAIEEKYNNTIKELREARGKFEEEGNTEKVEQTDRSIAQATKEKGQSLMALDYEKLKESPEYVRAFENLKETSSETLNSLLSQLENAKTAAAKVLSPDQLREYTTTIQDIMDELDARNPFQSLSDKKQELAEAEQELSQAQIELDNARQQAEAVKGGAKIENGITSSKFNPKTGKIDSTKAYLSEEQALARVKEKTENYNAAKDNLVKKDAKVKRSQKEVRAQIEELSKSISAVGDAIGGPAGEIISLIGNIGTFAITAMSGVEAAANTSSSAISTVEKASVILMIISAAVQVAMKMLDLFGGDDTTEKYEETKEVYESYINLLDKVIDKQLELAETLTGDSANAAYKKAIELVKTQSEAAKVLGKQYLDSGASWKSHSKGYEEVDDMSLDGWNQAAQSLGMSVSQFKNVVGDRMTGLFDLTDEQLAKLQENAPIFWAQLDSDTQKYANQVVDGVSKVSEVMEQKMSDATLIDVDTLRSDFQDLLTDMDSDTADFAGNFEEYMKNAILNSMLKEQYLGRLTEWRKKFYNAMDGGMTEDEYNELKAEGQQISEDMKADRDRMKDMFGWTGETDSSQDSTSKGFASMSQDTGEELNGRFTALQISNEEIKNSMLLAVGNLTVLTSSATERNIVLSEMRNLAIRSNSYLEDIAKYTKPLLEVGGKLDRIESNTKGLTSR